MRHTARLGVRSLVVLVCLLVAGPLAGTPLRALAAAGRDPSGIGVSARSDFNGDGFADLAIGVPNDDTGAASTAGAVNVMYGSSVGIQVNTPADQRWSQDPLEVKGTAETGDQFGAALAAGDFNGDGFADLAIGVPGDSATDQADAGVVNVLYGSVDGLEAETPIDDQLWTQDAVGVQDEAEAGDGFGSALAAGDFNGDGFVDLAIGVPDEAVGTVATAGAVNVLYGSVDGLEADAPIDDQFWNQNTTDVRGKAESADKFGEALAVGDFDQNGFPDLAVGASGQDVSSKDKAGAVSVLFSTASGLQATSPDDEVWNRDKTDVRDTADTFDHLGAALAAGDFNGDGFADLAMGAFGDDVGSPEILNAGSVSVLYGSSGGLQATSPDDQIWTQNSTSVQGKSEADDHFGDALVAADFDQDGFADLAVGVPLEDIGTANDTGMVNALYGASGGLQATARNDQGWDQDVEGVDGSNDSGDQFGAAVAVGDFNNDGSADLVVGVPGEIVGDLDGAGAINVLYATPSLGLQVDDPADVRKTMGTIGVEGDPGAGDSFGAAVAAG